MAGRKGNDYAVIAAPIGRLGVTIRDGRLVDLAFLGARARPRAPATGRGRRVCNRINAYFSNQRITFDLPLDLGGTPYQRRVWRALRRIPPGAALSYGALARRLRSSPRAVGGACRANPVPIVVPCHRVVAATGIGGFMGRRAGPALRRKQWLLEHERAR